MSNNTSLKLIKDLIIFYVKENYTVYLLEKNIKTIENSDLNSVIDLLYTQKKEHLKEFIKNSMKELLKDEHPGDLLINNIILDIFRDDILCKTTLKTEIELYQKNNLNK
tara:strand:- start:897 stop:1223 length:327 start_codon:yes stop_codon:yes gene_type:complete